MSKGIIFSIFAVIMLSSPVLIITILGIEPGIVIATVLVCILFVLFGYIWFRRVMSRHHSNNYLDKLQYKKRMDEELPRKPPFSLEKLNTERAEPPPSLDPLEPEIHDILHEWAKLEHGIEEVRSAPSERLVTRAIRGAVLILGSAVAVAGRAIGSVVVAGAKSAVESLDLMKAEPARDERWVWMLVTTTRRREGTEFSGERDEKLSFGETSVRIPESHQITKVEQPLKFAVFDYILYEEKLDEQRHFTKGQLKILSEEEWIARIKTFGAADCLVFVHGFNTGFKMRSSGLLKSFGT